MSSQGAGKTSTLVEIAKALEMQNKKGLYLAFNNGIAEEAKNKMPRLTDEQVKAVSLASNGNNMKLSAYAGAGKTSTLVEIAKMFEMQNKQGLYLAFNNGIAEEAKNKMPRNVFSSTFHALALSQSPNWIRQKLNYAIMFPKEFADRYRLYDRQVRTDKENFRTKKVKTSVSRLTVNSQKYYIDRAMSHFMKTASQYPQKRHMEHALEAHSNINSADISYVADLLTPVLQKLWEDYINPDVGIRITHDCYLKLWAMNKPQLNVDFILFDEAQDADPIMYQILINQQCQVIYVGDQFQQIYSWRGAVNMMQSLDKLDMQKTAITRSFRFSPTLAAYANPVLEFLGAESDLQGLETLVTEIDLNNPTPMDMDVILCRTNMTAIELVFEYASYGKIGLLKNIELDSTMKLLEKIDQFKNDSSTGNTHPILRWFQDYDELLNYQTEYPSDRDILPTLKIYQNFGLQGSVDIIKKCISAELKDEYDFVVTTAHRAKGLEFDKVLLANDFEKQFESDGNITVESLQKTNLEEFRLLYVAITRAKKKLYASNITYLMDVITRANTGDDYDDYN